MKRSVSILLAVLMLVSVFAVPAAARGYTLSVPKTEMAHNLEALGLHTMNVYSTFTPPTIDGVIGSGEYPGPNNGCSLSAVPGDNMYITPATGASIAGDQNGYLGRTDITDFVDDTDKPKYINNYLTYDEEYFYFGVTTLVHAIRKTNLASGETENYDEMKVPGSTRTIRNGYWELITCLNFMQSEDLAQVNNTQGWTRYRLYKGDAYTAPVSVDQYERELSIYNEATAKYVTTDYSKIYYTDPDGVTWNSTTYKAKSNFCYQITKQPDGSWGIVFEGRMPLGDILRMVDVEYEDGSPIDYVPGWGSWGCAFSYPLDKDFSKTTINGTLIEYERNDVVYAQTGLPARGYGEYNVGSYVAGFLFNNTVDNATNVNRIINNPVRFLGVYDPNYDYDQIFSAGVTTSTLVSATSRVTRTRAPMLTSGVRGMNNRVVGVATTAASATGDSTTMTVVLSVAMILCAAGAVTVVAMKKRSR